MLSDRGLLSYTSFALKEKFFFNEKRIIGAGSIPIAIGMTRIYVNVTSEKSAKIG